jgi:hypothetical protein
MQIPYDKLDSDTYAIYLEVSGSTIVFLQGCFELYEGVGIVRTLSVKKSLICILTVPDMYNDCIALLYSIKDLVPWRVAEMPTAELRDLYHGYGKRGKDL